MTIAEWRPEGRRLVVLQAAAVATDTRRSVTAVPFQSFVVELGLVGRLGSSWGNRRTTAAGGNTVRSG